MSKQKGRRTRRAFTSTHIALCSLMSLTVAHCGRAWTGGIHAALRMSAQSSPSAGSTLTVERVEARGPAAIAGLRVGEIVLAIDGVPTHDMTEQELRDRVRGEVGSWVVLRVRAQDGAERDVRIERGP